MKKKRASGSSLMRSSQEKWPLFLNCFKILWPQSIELRPLKKRKMKIKKRDKPDSSGLEVAAGEMLELFPAVFDTRWPDGDVDDDDDVNGDGVDDDDGDDGVRHPVACKHLQHDHRHHHH